MIRKILLVTSFAVLTSGCSTISEESCVEGSWESIGYEDARYGESRGLFDKIAETCEKYGIMANATEYNKGYDRALPLYCTFDRGITHGEGGGSARSQCVEINVASYLDGWEEGRVVYEIRQGREVLIEAYDEIREDILYLDREFIKEDVTDTERSRLRKNRRAFMRDLDEIRIDIRAYELVHDLPKYDLDVPIPPWRS